MIQLTSETVVSFTQATRHVPSRRAGKKCAVQTLHRWSKNGYRGIKLESIRVGGTLCTSLEAIQRFCEALSSGNGGGQAVSGQESRRRAGNAADVVDQQLVAEGFDHPLVKHLEGKKKE